MMLEQRDKITTIEICPLPSLLFAELVEGGGEAVWLGLSRRAFLHSRRLRSITLAAEAMRREEIAQAAQNLHLYASQSHDPSRTLNSPGLGLWIRAAVHLLDAKTEANIIEGIAGGSDTQTCNHFLLKLAAYCMESGPEEQTFCTDDHSPLARVWVPGLRQPNEWLAEKNPWFIETHQRAWERIRRSIPWMFQEALRTAVKTIVHSCRAGRLVSTTFSEMLGCVYLTEHKDDSLVGEQLVHEYSHTRLFAAQTLDDLLHESYPNESWEDQRFYSPWRQDPRPLNGVLHACYVFTNIARYWLGQLEDSTYAAGRLGLILEQLKGGFATLDKYAKWTNPGQAFYRRLVEAYTSTKAEAQSHLNSSSTIAHDIEALNNLKRITCHEQAQQHAKSWRTRHPNLAI